MNKTWNKKFGNVPMNKLPEWAERAMWQEYEYAQAVKESNKKFNSLKCLQASLKTNSN